ncbi:hypothetical protein [Brevundimonas sp.]|uniref:hypothetical protein n=1 Tax=Brevundimonas sp. TaxID=1871086 RepID=UPI002FC72E55
MKRPIRLWPARTGYWRTPAIVLLSLGLHAAVLGSLALKAFDPPRQYGDGGLDDPMFPRPLIYLRIEPRPLLRGETARTRETPRPPQPVETMADAGTRVTEAPGATGSADAGDRRIQPTPLASAPEVPARRAGVGVLSWPAHPRPPGDRMGRSLRTSLVGCASPGLLDTAEQALCDERLARRASLARDPGPPPNQDRDEAFARQAEANDAWRAYTRDEGPYPGLRSLFTQR